MDEVVDAVIFPEGIVLQYGFFLLLVGGVLIGLTLNGILKVNLVVILLVAS